MSLTPEEQAGQLVMVGVTEVTPSADLLELFETHKFGSVVILGNNVQGRANVAVLTSKLSGINADIPVLVSVDQEGGQIQRLTGQGFTRIPAATTQAAMSAADLQAQWKLWAHELQRAGVLFNLAPVADVVPANLANTNAPIGKLKRNYGNDVKTTSISVEAAIKGMKSSGVATSVKHFPGLGKVTSNTDFAIAKDDVTTANSPDVEAFSAAIAAGASSVMVSSAIYTKIDPANPAVFSKKVITDVLRGQMGFQGLVISDDLGAAQSVAKIPVKDRALRFVNAGGDVIISASPEAAVEMTAALVEWAQSDPNAAHQLGVHAGRVLALKAAVGTVECS